MTINLELSQHQQTFWYLHQTEGDQPFYHVGKIYKIEGNLHSEWFEEIINSIIDKHESLQTAYEFDEMGQGKVSIKKFPFCQTLVDCSVFPESEREKRGYHLAVREFNLPFVLEKGDLLHSALIKVSDVKWYWALAMPHIIADLFAYNIFIEQFKGIYEAKLHNQPLPEIRNIHISEIYEQERSQEVQNLAIEAKEYWKKELTPLPGPLNLPKDITEDTDLLNGEFVPFSFNERDSFRLNQLSQGLGISLFSVLSATVSSFLSQFALRDDFILGYEFANRILPGSNEWIWPRVNQLCLRVEPKKDRNFDSLAQDIQKKIAMAFKYQDFPFHRIPALLNLKRDGTSRELVSVKILMEPPRKLLSLDTLTVEEEEVPNNTGPFPLVFRFSNTTGLVSGEISFQKNLFSLERVQDWKKKWMLLTNQILDCPQLSLMELKNIIAATPENSTIRSKPIFQRKARSFLGIESISVKKADPNWNFPLLVQPKVKGVMLDTWLNQNKEIWNSFLAQHGGILFRDFDVLSPDQFEKVALAIHPEKVEYVEPSQPRPEFKEKVYISTEYPASEILHQHSELNYTYHWPLKGLLCCLEPSLTGGETPLADNREILGRLDPEVLRLFEEKGVMYQRNYGDGLLVPWQKVFKTDDPKEVEAYCRENEPMSCEWKEDGGLRTRQVRPATIEHPVTGEKVWFNQFHLFHAGSIGRERFKELLDNYSEDNLPAHSFFGDGTPISIDILEHVYCSLRKSCISIPWEKGDVMLVDNVLISHGRNSFTGNRKVLACFVEPRTK